MKNSVFIPLLYFSTLSSNAQKNNHRFGTVLCTYHMLDTNSGRFIVPAYMRDTKLWYKDSFLIAEKYSIYIESDNRGMERWKTVVDHVVFIDARTDDFYVYSSFSDTAQFIKKYSQPDTGRVEEGWTFFQKKKAFSYDNKQLLPDTTIEQIRYKRIMSSGYESDGNIRVKNIQIAYARYDSPNPFIRIDLLLSQELGYPIVRLDRIAENVQWIKVEYKYISDKLTSEELKIFDTWKKNIKLYK